MNELESLLILNNFPYIGSVKARFLIDYFGSAKNVLEAPIEAVGALPGFGPKILQNWKKTLEGQAWKQDLLLAERLQTDLIAYTDSRYPKQLLKIADFPLILYLRGELLPEDSRSIAVVGTRQASIYGLEMAEQISLRLAQLGFTVVSGLARGVDTAAHRGALAGGRTLAVIGSGLASIYPVENISLAQAIAQKGALISEFPMQAAPEKHHFPRRNRLVSGMTMGTLLVEAPQKSGAMLTAANALDQGRQLFALPGRADLFSFGGNHALIKTRKAELIESAEEIAAYFGQPLHPSSPAPSSDVRGLLGSEELHLLQQMPRQEISIDEMVEKISLPAAKLSGLLMGLVLKKMVKEYPGKIYKKLIE